MSAASSQRFSAGLQSHCAGEMVRRLSRLLTREYDAHFSKIGLKLSQYSVLRVLKSSPELSMASLAGALAADPSTISRNVRILLRRGWVERIGCREDSRRSLLRLSAAGTVTLELAEVVWREAENEVRRALGTTNLKTLRECTGRCIERLSDN